MKRAGFFNTGGSRSLGYTLSLYGQRYVDTLPDGDAIKKLHKPKPTKPKNQERKERTNLELEIKR
jgi:hypothetical protein